MDRLVPSVATVDGRKRPESKKDPVTTSPHVAAALTATPDEVGAHGTAAWQQRGRQQPRGGGYALVAADLVPMMITRCSAVRAHVPVLVLVTALLVVLVRVTAWI